MNTFAAWINDDAVRDPVTRPGWYVLGRARTERWRVLACRDRLEHIEASWFNTSGAYDERVLCYRESGSPLQVVRRSQF